MLNFQTHQLDNGLKLITAPLTTSEAVTILILVKIGGRYEKADQQGISHFLEHVFFKGTKNRPTAYDLAKELDGLGANYNAFTSEELTGFYIQSDANDFEKSLELLSDLFLNPIFPKDEIEREKGVILEEANMRRDVPQAHVQVLNQQQMFPSISLGRDLVGTAETIKNTTREDLIEYFKSGYNPDSTYVVICGNLKNHTWQTSAEKYFKMEKSGHFLTVYPYKPEIIKKLVQEVRKVDQTHFILSYLTFAKSDPRRYALSLLSIILAGGMSSRLFTEIREKRGWAYYVRSDISNYEDIGTISFYAGVKKDKLSESIALIKEQIEDISSHGPNEDELKRAKQNLRGHLALALEDSFEIASYLAEEAIFEDKIRQPEEIIEKLNAVSAKDIQSLSQDIFKSDKMGLAIVGPKKYEISL